MEIFFGENMQYFYGIFLIFGPIWAQKWAQMGPWAHMGQGPWAHLGQGPWAHMGQGPWAPMRRSGGGLRPPPTTP